MTKRTKHMRKLGGRPRKIGAPRDGAGRIDRNWIKDESERNAMSVALEARMRIFGVDAEAAKQPNITDVLERMVINKALDRRQADALIAFRTAHNAYQRAIGAKPDTGTEPRPEIAGSGTWEDFVASSVARWERMKDAIERLRRQQASYGHQCKPWAALTCFVVWNQHDHKLTGDLRVAANALADLEGGRRVA